ncbi:unnamed protein product [Parnassius apollo]|uniref:(apollo) hypothetical protein n=1 Tax=Parnassius apollo TaxID=110799 RepID=A0A8S3W2I0_PARAO|nr:unnamed protein product [Parnassius apollo]
MPVGNQGLGIVKSGKKISFIAEFRKLEDGTIIDMGADEGVFVYSDAHNSYLLYGMKVFKSFRKIGKDEHMTGILEDYKIIHPAKEGNKLVNLRHLEACSGEIE